MGDKYKKQVLQYIFTQRVHLSAILQMHRLSQQRAICILLCKCLQWFID